MKEALLEGDIVIAKARVRDAADIANILLAAWLYTYPNEEYQITEADVRKKFGEIDRRIIGINRFLDSTQSNTTITYLVAQLKAEISGFIYCIKTQDNLNINSLYVHPKYHRLGIGSSLLREGIILNPGINHATLDVVSYNTQAIAFYRRHDFVIQGPSQTPFSQFPDGKTIPEIRMIRACSDTRNNQHILCSSSQ